MSFPFPMNGRRGDQSESTVWTEMGCRWIGVDCSWYWENWRSRRVKKMARGWKSSKSRSSRFNSYGMVFLCEQAKFAVLVIVIVVFIIPTLFAVSLNYLLGRLTRIFKIVVPIFCNFSLGSSSRQFPLLYLKFKIIIPVLRDSDLCNRKIRMRFRNKWLGLP